MTQFNASLGLNVLVNPDNKVHGANMGPNWGRQDPGGPHVELMNFAIREGIAMPSENVHILACRVTVCVYPLSPSLQIKFKIANISVTNDVHYTKKIQHLNDTIANLVIIYIYIYIYI